MMRALLAVAFICLALTGCEDGSGPGSPPFNPSVRPDALVENHVIRAYDITGTSADVAPGLAPVDPAENGGKFTLVWSVQAVTTGLLLQLFLSDDDVYSPADVSFYGHYCTSGTDCGMTIPHTLECTFSSANTLQCDGQTAAQDITAFLGTLPRDAFIIARSCDMRYLNCDVRAHPVRFR